jgi:hypothetical protein
MPLSKPESIIPEQVYIRQTRCMPEILPLGDDLDAFADLEGADTVDEMGWLTGRIFRHGGLFSGWLKPTGGNLADRANVVHEGDPDHVHFGGIRVFGVGMAHVMLPYEVHTSDGVRFVILITANT